jgi:hypothetical protein
MIILAPHVKPNAVSTFRAASLAFFIVLAIVHTWPLATAPGRWSRNDTHDTIHHEWILAWDAHQLAHDPLRLFDSNVFYPERDTLAYSDHLIVQAVMVAPLLWAGASPVFAYNAALLAGLVLTGWMTSLVVARWTGSRAAGMLSGSLMAFNALTLTRFPEVQDQHLEFFPLALWALDCLLRTQRIRHAVHLAGWFVLQALTCGYLLVFTAISLVAGAAVRPLDWTGPRFRRTALLLVAAGAGSAAALTPFLIPYFRVSREHGFTRSPEEVAMFSARVTDYLATGARVHFSLWSHRFFEHDALFPGVIASALVLMAAIGGVAWKDRRARMAVAFGLVAFALSFGPAFPLYGAVSRALPIMAGIRGASRFGQIVLAAVAILAGFGFAAIRSRSRAHGVTLAIAFIAGVNLEALRAPIAYRAFEGIPPVFDSLGAREHELVACFPFPPRQRAFENVDCMLASTRFWHPLLNGYSSFMPESYNVHAAALAGFPEGTTLHYLQQLGVTKIIVFTNKLSSPRLAHLDEHPELSLWKADESVRIYELSSP